MGRVALSGRLRGLLSLLPPQCERLIDVGCDHGLLGLGALEEARCRRLVAIDLEEEPLARARKLLTERGWAEQSRFLRADGLSALELKSGDCVVVAGLGGLEICDILSAARFARDEEALLRRGEGALRFVLQPMKSQALLRLFLLLAGFQTERELLLRERGRYYTLIALGARGCRAEPGLKERMLERGASRWLRAQRAALGCSILELTLGAALAARLRAEGWAALDETARGFALREVRHLYKLAELGAFVPGLGYLDGEAEGLLRLAEETGMKL